MLRFKMFTRLFVAVLAIIFIASPAFSQILNEKTLDRPYEVRFNVVKDMKEFLGIPISELHLFAYRGEQNKWEPIPFQIDERDGDVEPNYFAEHNGLLDPEDELAYLVRDLGDKVPEGVWLDNEESQSFVRYEIQAHDTTSTENTKAAWAYVYRSKSITDKSPISYMTYDESKDIVKSLYYEIAYNINGVLDDLWITENGGGSYINILDRQKYRIGLYAGPNEVILREIDFILKDVKAIVGPIRIIRRASIDLQPEGQDPWLTDQQMTSKFFPFYLQYSGNIPLDKFGGSANINIELVRQTLDFNDNAIGMKFSNPFNKDIVVDGTPDASLDDSLYYNVINWMMLTGNQGTVLVANDFTPIGSSQRLYFRDNTIGVPFDTGDNKSYGEMGVQFIGYRIADILTYKSQIFFLPANQPHEKGEMVLADFSNPVAEIWREQTYATDVKPLQKSVKPNRFRLQQNYPNPFNPETTIGFEVPREARVKISIMNILGQEIKTLVDKSLPAGQYQTVWHGDDDSGRKVVSGIYFYQLESGSFRDLKKMIMID